MGKLFYTRRNKFSYKPSPDGKGLDEENLKNFIGIGIPFTFKNTPETEVSEPKELPSGYSNFLQRGKEGLQAYKKTIKKKCEN
jgi:hypothetical protein